MLKGMYRIVYRIVTTVSQYVSYREQMYLPTPNLYVHYFSGNEGASCLWLKRSIAMPGQYGDAIC